MQPLPTVPTLIEGGVSVDDRGAVTFANGFDFSGVKRFYMVENFSTEVIRAFHGHKHEAKYVFVASGAAVVVVIPMQYPQQVSSQPSLQRFVLSARKPSILFIPAGYANGFRPLEPNSKIFFYSTSTLEESKNDDYRFPADYLGKEIWQVENR